MHFRPLLVLAALTASACDHSSAGSATAASASASTPPPAAPSASASAAPPPSSSAEPEAPEGAGNPPRLADADVEGLEKGLKCSAASAAKPGPCKVLAAMEKCVE